MPELPVYTVLAALAVALVVTLELLVLRTGLFRTVRYWLTILIVLGFQVPVNGWLTKSQATVVYYHPDVITGVRAPVSFPVEDFGFGFAMVTLTVALWHRHRHRHRACAEAGAPATSTVPACPRSGCYPCSGSSVPAAGQAAAPGVTSNNGTPPSPT